MQLYRRCLSKFSPIMEAFIGGMAPPGMPASNGIVGHSYVGDARSHTAIAHTWTHAVTFDSLESIYIKEERSMIHRELLVPMYWQQMTLSQGTHVLAK